MENGLTTKRMVEVYKYGQMDLDTKVSGAIIEPMGMDEWFMLKVIFMRVNGLTIKLMEKELILKIKEVNIKELGSTINKTDLE